MKMNMTNQEDTPPSWDATWESIYSQQEWGRYPSEHVIRFVARNFYQRGDRRATRLLDLGCGPGACTWYMAREGFSVAGIDGSASGIRRAGERLAAERLTADLRVGDYVRLPWADGEFDGVVNNVTLTHNRFAQCQRAVSEVVRVLKPSGLFLSCNFTDRCWGYGSGREVEPGTFTDIAEGVLSGRGLVLFMSRSQVDELYRPFAERSVELVSWTTGEMNHRIELWIVTCRK